MIDVLVAAMLHLAPREPIVQPVMPTLLRVHSRDDERGVEPSAYRGRWFVKRHEGIRKCILRRESGGAYMMRDGGGYQFMSYSRWPRSLSFMLKPETRAVFGRSEANRMQRVLRSHEVNEWSRYWQDAAFWVVWRKGAGAKHWNPTVPGTGCF